MKRFRPPLTICKPKIISLLFDTNVRSGVGWFTDNSAHPYVEGIGGVPGKSIQSMSCEMEL